MTVRHRAGHRENASAVIELAFTLGRWQHPISLAFKMSLTGGASSTHPGCGNLESTCLGCPIQGHQVVALSLTSGNSAVSFTIKVPSRRFDLFGSVWACYIKLSWRSFLSVAPAGTSTGASLNKEGNLNVVGIPMSEKMIFLFL